MRSMSIGLIMKMRYVWNISLFAREITGVNSHGYECVHGTVWTYCIPYGGNEDLL